MDGPNGGDGPSGEGGPSPLHELSAALQRGEDVLGAWYEAAFPKVARLCRGFLARGEAVAEDIAQDAMLRLIDQLHRWDANRSYEAWQRTVTLNLCRNFLRAESRRGHHEETAGKGLAMKKLPDPSNEMEQREVAELVQRLMAVLAPREREAFILVDLEGMRPVDAAEVMGVQGSTVRAGLTIARRRMREALRPFLGTDGRGNDGLTMDPEGSTA